MMLSFPAGNAKVEAAVDQDGNVIGVSVILLVLTEDIGLLPGPFDHSAERVLLAYCEAKGA